VIYRRGAAMSLKPSPKISLAEVTIRKA